LRFNGKINSFTISQSADIFFVSFSMKISKDEYLKTHNKSKNNNLALSIYVGLKSFLSLSNVLEIKAHKPLAKFNRLMIKIAR
ncbi:transposase, partial [Campylobacter jejuni]|nr:transposase [Campylobacter jejuni]